MPRVVCLACRREEGWTLRPGGVDVVILQEGGHRRTAQHAQWVRGTTALRAWAGETGPVVGVCDGCGQLLVAEEAGLAPIPVRIDTPEGPLLIDRRVEGPIRELSREEAQAFLDRQYLPTLGQTLRSWAADLPRMTLFFGMLGPLVFCMGGASLLMSFFWALALQGIPGEP